MECINTVCYFFCHPGYDPISSASRKCLENGTWNGRDFFCQGAKLLFIIQKSCLRLHKKKEGLNKLIYGLSTIFKVSICVIWKVTSVFFNFRLFKTVMTCPTMIIPPKGILLTPSCGNTYGTYCVFACENGYASRVGNVTRTCLESSLWSGENIKCTGTGTSLRFYFCMKVRQTNNWVMKGQTTINNKNNK